MAHQDYISRKPKKKAADTKAQAQLSSSIPIQTKVVAFITLLAVIGFGGFLYSIKDKSEANVVEPEATITTQPTIELPTPPKEKWTYMEDLKSKEVEVGEYEVVDKGPYKMQCASFRTMRQAESMKAKMAFLGLEAQISETKGKNGTYFKVFIGPYERKRQAEKDRHKLKNNNINTCQIWSWT